MDKLNLHTFREIIFDYEESKEWKYKGDKPCVIKFYSEWCSACAEFEPIFSAVSQELSKQADFYEVNIDEQEALASMFAIRSIPSLVFISEDNSMPSLSVGALPKDELYRALKELLNIER